MSVTTPAARSVQCVWCKIDYKPAELRHIPGTKIQLCGECWKRYQGDTEEEV